jgi:hypothetical protein
MEYKLTIKEWADGFGIKLSAGAVDALVSIISDAYDDGYSNNESPPDTSWLEDLETGLRLIDTDRAAAAVYLDRCTKHAERYLIEVAPCLL